MDSIDEQWIDLPLVRNRKYDIVAISNTGKYRRFDGTIGILELRQKVKYDNKSARCYKIIAEHFLITVKRPDQICIDHITHHPTEYNVNNVLNLRWCTYKENSNFEEAKVNQSGEKASSWKGDNVGPSGAYKRARKLYKAEKITEEEFQPYRDKWNEYKIAKRKQISSQSSENLTD